MRHRHGSVRSIARPWEVYTAVVAVRALGGVHGCCGGQGAVADTVAMWPAPIERILCQVE